MAKLSDFNLIKCIYMSAGSHAGETIEQIIERKQKEIEICGWGLWAFSSPIAKNIYEMCKNEEELFAVMPVTGEDTVGNPVTAKFYYTLDSNEKRDISSDMKVTFSGTQGYALVVEKYFFIDDDDNIFPKSNYERRKYFNGVELLEQANESKKTKTKKKIKIIAKLKKPYIVGLTE